MTSRSLLLFSFLLCMTPMLSGEEIELTYTETDQMPASIYSLMPLFDDSLDWTNKEGLLTDQATTYLFNVPFNGLSEQDQILFTLDFSAKEGKRADLLYLDLNRNRTMDKGEKFSLAPPSKPVSFAAPDSTYLGAEKVPLPKAGSRSASYLANIYCIYAPSPYDDSEDLAFSVIAWGCMKGRVELMGKAYAVTLVDYTANGVFGDHEKEDSLQYDLLSLIPDGKKAVGSPGPSDMLRRKMILEDQGYALQIKEGGKKLVFNPIQVELGMVDTGAPDLAVQLYHPDWGTYTLEPGSKAKIPAGTWTVKDFVCMSNDGKKTLACTGSKEMKVEVLSGKENSLEIDTQFKAKVTPKKRRTVMQLSLQLNTAQGASFLSYDGGDKSFKGIPFVITNASGEKVHEDIFKFG